MFEMASLFDDLNRQGSGSVLKSARGQARRRKASPAGRPTPGKPTQRCICAGCWHTEVGGLQDGCARTFTRESRCASHARLEKVDPDVLISKVGGVDSKDGDLGFYYLFSKF
jgi:hypothetical protein